MDIQVTIPDEQAAALAWQYNIRSFTDANDLISQVASEAYLRQVKQAIIGSVAIETDPSLLATMASDDGQTLDNPVQIPTLSNGAIVMSAPTVIAPPPQPPIHLPP